MKVLLCGLGSMGSNHLRVLMSLNQEFDVVGVVDANPKRLADAKSLHGVTGFTNISEAVETTKPEAVVVVTPTETHFEICKEILEKGIALFVEKPITKNVKQGLELARLADSKKIPFMVGHIERFNPAVVAVRELIRRGDVGDLISVSVKRVGGNPRDVKGAGDVLGDLAVHDIDIVSWLTGQTPKLLDCVGHKSQAIDSASMLFSCGATTVDMHVNWVTPVKIRQIQVTGTKGFIEVNLITQQVVWTKQNPVLIDFSTEKSQFFFDEYLLSFAAPDKIEVGILKREPLREEMRAFWKSVTTGAPMPVTAHEAVQALDLALQARAKVEKQLASSQS